MSQHLSTQLRSYGCELAPPEFKRVLAGTKRELFPNLTDEHLICADEENTTYCDEVRRRVGVELPGPFIRVQLLNVRKSQARV